MDVVLFEDAAVARLSPAALTRPAYAISCGSFRLCNWFSNWQAQVLGLVRPHLQQIQLEDFGIASHSARRADQDCLIVNARLVPAAAAMETLRRWCDRGVQGVVRCGEDIAAAFVSGGAMSQLPDGAAELVECLATRADLTSEFGTDLRLLNFAHDIVKYHREALPNNLAWRISHQDVSEVADGVFAGHNVSLADQLGFDTANGPVVIDDGVVVKPFAYLSGPVYLGPGCQVNEHASLRDHVSVGAASKVGGEIGATVLEAYSNKQHAGYLGHAYVGSWVNLGAGTSNSDLKNSYGTIRMEYEHQRVDTGMQFMGCVIGDYVKSAINTSIFTGKRIGVGSTIYGYVTTDVPCFVNYAKSFGQVTEQPPGVLLQTQKRMCERRGRVLRPVDAQLIRDIYALTCHGRQLVDKPLVL